MILSQSGVACALAPILLFDLGWVARVLLLFLVLVATAIVAATVGRSDINEDDEHLDVSEAPDQSDGGSGDEISDGREVLGISIVGVYAIAITKPILRENWRVLYPNDEYGLSDLESLSDPEVQERFKGLSLIEMKLASLPENLDMGKFQQESPGSPADNWQVAYFERFLSPDGTKVVEVPAPGLPARIIFFIHFLDLSRPIATPFGPVRLPRPMTLPPRLRELGRYLPP